MRRRRDRFRLKRLAPATAVALALVIAIGIPGDFAAKGATVFTYVGNRFDTFSGDDACPPQCNLSGSFTVAGPLTAYFAQGYPPGVIVITHPDQFSFTDGLATVTNQTIAQEIASGLGNGVGVNFEFVLDSTGEPDFSKGWVAQIAWNDATIGPTVPLDYLSSIDQGSGGIGTFGTLDQTYHFVAGVPGNLNVPGSGSALVANSPGVWTVATTAGIAPSVPEPSTWAMMLIGFVGLGFAGCRGSRANPPGPTDPARSSACT